MQRVPEADLMLGVEQARAYALADFSEPHQQFIELFQQHFALAKPHSVLDLGCGTGDVTLRLARAYPDSMIYGVDGSDEMLFFAHQAIYAEMFHNQIKLIKGYLPDIELPLQRFDTIISNSLLHHLKEPQDLWHTVARYAAPGATIMSMDLLRPESISQVRDLVRQYALNEPPQLQQDFYNSLCAAYRKTEVEGQLQVCGLSGLKVEVVSDRHLLVYGTLS